MLEVDGLSKSFGGLTAVNDVSFDIDSGEIVGLIGPNGAGKTTMFNMISGVYKPNSGEVYLDSDSITGKRPNEICNRGVVRTFQIVRTFDESTVLENVLTGAVFGSNKSRSMEEAREIAHKYISFVGIDGREDTETSELTIADRKHVELARGLACEPKLMMLDEIGSGLTPAELNELTETIERIRDELGVSVFWIEHIMDAILGSTDRVLVLNEGQLIAEGKPEEIKNDEKVAKAYLGGTA
ncbi:ABC transporter ATP-binding protein [Natronosalvus halobius]|uniref:ABC transporter ATP-binding protein n=1 Tax=Natronosalvus halobius TaxID=2953746 RepID=UPI0020A18875|nr:ABC transporter ATP-binding protein [Natronosalvus halobius]USZ73647.1 ABC transporter ATP-binding protein [Natronosalvus halobius]